MAEKFGKGTVSIAGNKPEVSVTCFNGDPEDNGIVTLSKNATLADGSPLVEGQEVILRIKSNGKVDDDHIFPYGSGQDPMALTEGGIGRGVVTDVNQDPYGGSASRFTMTPDGELAAAPLPDPIPKAMGVSFDMINGTDFMNTIVFFDLPNGSVFPLGQEVFFLCVKQDDHDTIIAMVEAAGTCV